MPIGLSPHEITLLDLLRRSTVDSRRERALLSALSAQVGGGGEAAESTLAQTISSLEEEHATTLQELERTRVWAHDSLKNTRAELSAQLEASGAELEAARAEARDSLENARVELSDQLKASGSELEAVRAEAEAALGLVRAELSAQVEASGAQLVAVVSEGRESLGNVRAELSAQLKASGAELEAVRAEAEVALGLARAEYRAQLELDVEAIRKEQQQRGEELLGELQTLKVHAMQVEAVGIEARSQVAQLTIDLKAALTLPQRRYREAQRMEEMLKALARDLSHEKESCVRLDAARGRMASDAERMREELSTVPLE